MELAGIEPASSSAVSGLLRVQSVVAFSQSRCSHEHVTDGLSQDLVPINPPDRSRSASPLNEAWVRDEDGCPVRPFDHCSGSESEVSALSVGTYWFPAIVNEITLASRPASPETYVPSRNRSAPC